MATQPEDLTADFGEDDPELDLGDEHDEPEGDDESGDGSAPSPANDDAADEADVISFGETAVAGEDENPGVKNLREELKRERARIRELEAKVAPAAEDIGAKPNRDDYWDRDEEEYDRDYDAWKDRKRKAEEGAAKQRELTDTVAREIADAVTSYDQQRATLKVPAFDAAHDRVTEKLGESGANILRIVAGDKAAALTYALGNSDERLAALGKYNLGKLTDVVKLAADVGRLAGEMRVERRKPGTQPESVHSGGAAPRGDQRRAALEKEADRTNDYSKLAKYDREQKGKNRG